MAYLYLFTSLVVAMDISERDLEHKCLEISEQDFYSVLLSILCENKYIIAGMRGIYKWFVLEWFSLAYFFVLSAPRGSPV
jgi:hypothetical protein